MTSENIMALMRRRRNELTRDEQVELDDFLEEATDEEFALYLQLHPTEATDLMVRRQVITEDEIIASEDDD